MSTNEMCTLQFLWGQLNLWLCQLRYSNLNKPMYTAFHQHFSSDVTSASFAFNWSHGREYRANTCSARDGTNIDVMWCHYQRAGEKLYSKLYKPPEGWWCDVALDYIELWGQSASGLFMSDWPSQPIDPWMHAGRGIENLLIFYACRTVGLRFKFVICW